MNAIEQKFYDAVFEYYAAEREEALQILSVSDEINKDTILSVGLDIEYQKGIGIYIADFLFTLQMPTPDIKVVVEIDGHESHKTKEQRYSDYRKERFFLHEGYRVMRFMGSEIFVDANICVDEVNRYIESIKREQYKLLQAGKYVIA